MKYLRWRDHKQY